MAADSPPAHSTPADSTPPPPQPRACPRVERAARMSTGYAGWSRDIPIEEMALALDVVVPIQEQLGNLFCPPALSDCRPLHLLGIELADARPSSAVIRVRGVAAAPTRELELVLWWANETWQADAASLSAYLAHCRAAEAAADR